MGVQFSAGGREFPLLHSFQNGSAAYPASPKSVRGPFLREIHENYLPPPSNSKVKNVLSYTSIPPTSCCDKFIFSFTQTM
jgi:hypothetical protein